MPRLRNLNGVGRNQFDGHPGGEGVAEHLSVANDENIGYGRMGGELAFQQALWAWQKARLGSSDGDVVVLDGEALRGSGSTQLVGAINARNGRSVGVEVVSDKSNEIPAGQTLLERLDLNGTIALMDALHTQVETARAVVQGGGGDYVLVVKGSQGDLQEKAQSLLPETFSP